MSAWFWLMLCFLVRSSEAQVNITAELGQDVTLTCRAPNNNNKTIRVVEWSRPGLDLDTVLVSRNGHLYPDDQHPSYRNRVDLQDRQMKDGDVSLVLKDVKIEDTGRYECRVFQRGTDGLMKDPIITTYLVVLKEGGKGGQSGDGGDKVGGDKNKIIAGSVVGVILLAVILLAGGFLIYKTLKRQKSHRPVPPDEAAAVQM